MAVSSEWEAKAWQVCGDAVGVGASRFSGPGRVLQEALDRLVAAALDARSAMLVDPACVAARVLAIRLEFAEREVAVIEEEKEEATMRW